MLYIICGQHALRWPRSSYAHTYVVLGWQLFRALQNVIARRFAISNPAGTDSADSECREAGEKTDTQADSSDFPA